jgi:gluconate kinase
MPAAPWLCGFERANDCGANTLWETRWVSVIFLSGPIGAGKTTVAMALAPLLPAPLSYIEGDTFWSFIRKGGERGLREHFPVLLRSMTAAAVPFARSGFRVLIDFSIPPAFVDTARKILKDVPFDFVLLRPSLEVCVERAASRKEGAITDHAMLKNFYARFEDGRVEPICDDEADPATLARQIADGLNQGRFRVA